MVSAAKLRRAQESVVAARPYADKMMNVLSSLALREEEQVHPLLEARGKKRALILLMTADRGLCGGFNANVSKEAERFIRSKPEGFDDYDLMIVGRKGKDYLKARGGLQIVKVHENLTAKISYSTAALLAQEMIAEYTKAKYDAVFLVFNAFRSAITQEVTVQRLLPIVPKTVAEGAHVAEYLYEPEPDRGPEADSAQARGGPDFPRVAGIFCFRAWRAHECHGQCQQKRLRDDQQVDPPIQQGTAGRYYQRAYGNYLRC